MSMRKEKELFFRLIRIAIGTEDPQPMTLTEGEWLQVIGISLAQAVSGIVMMGMEKLPPESMPPQKVLQPWMAWAAHIEDMNRKLNNIAAEATAYFKGEGCRAMILKGQGVAELYPQPLRRTPDGINILLDNPTDTDASAAYRHIGSDIMSKPLELEVHSIPTWMDNPMTDRRLQRMFRHWKEEGFGTEIPLTGTEGRIRIPAIGMNRIYLLVQIFRHLPCKGIGLRLMMDYFYVLQKGMNDAERSLFVSQVRSLKLERFAGAVMYVLGRAFAMPERLMPVPPSEKYGKRLLREITPAGRFSARMSRTARFIADYPNEALWIPHSKFWHYFRERKKIKVNEGRLEA